MFKEFRVLMKTAWEKYEKICLEVLAVGLDESLFGTGMPT